MRTTSKVLLRTDKYIAVKSMGKLYIFRFIGVTKSNKVLLEEAQRFLLEEDSICYGCPHYCSGDSCVTQSLCIEGSMNSNRMEG